MDDIGAHDENGDNNGYDGHEVNGGVVDDDGDSDSSNFMKTSSGTLAINWKQPIRAIISPI
mgnify:CR=1 FL=1